MTVAPNLIFPGLDFRVPAEPSPIRIEVRGAYQRANRIAQKSRQAYSDMLRAFATEQPRPTVGKFTVLDLDDTVCHWPVTGGSPFLFCGAATACPPYCTEHAPIARWRPGVKRSKHFELRNLSAR